MKADSRYSLYLASGIGLWKTGFRKYSRHFNHRLDLFEPGTIDIPKDHRKIPISTACYDLNKINHSDALLVYMKYYDPADGSPPNTDSAWEYGYSISLGKPVIVLIEDKEHIDYYASQWMISFSINAVLTADEEVAKILKDHPKFVHVKILLAQNPEQFETKIIEYLDDYYRSIYSRSGIINYFVDKRAREIFSRKELERMLSAKAGPDRKIMKELGKTKNLRFCSDGDSLTVCEVERKISGHMKNRISEKTVDSAIAAVLKFWNRPMDHMLDCLEHSIKPPFESVRGRRHGIKKTRTELFFELYDLVNHHLIKRQKFIKSASFPYEMGAVIELYNWMNTYALDDVFDNSKYRQNLKTVWFRFTRRDSIFTGILGHLLSIKYLLRIASEDMRIACLLGGILNDYNHMMYEGQVIDLMLTFDSKKKKGILKSRSIDQILELYVKRIYGICGGFFEAIGELAAKAGNKEEQIVNAKEIDDISPLIGMYYGIIQMIRNDLGDYIMPEDFSKLSKGMKDVSHSDVIEGKADMTYLIAMRSPCMSKKERGFLFDSLYKKLTKKEKKRINQLLWKSGAIDLTVELIINIIKHVEENLLTKYHETPTRMKWMFSLVCITKRIMDPFRKQALRNGWAKYEPDPALLKRLTCMITGLEKKQKKERLKI